MGIAYEVSGVYRGIIGGADSFTIYVNCGYFVGPFNHNWNTNPHKIEIREFDEHPIDFAWFMKELTTASTVYKIFDDNPLLASSLLSWIDDEEFFEKISDEQLRLFKKYASLQSSWRKKEHIISDLYFPILLGLNRCGSLAL